MKLRPKNGRVAVRPVETAEKTNGLIIIPEAAKGNSTEGIVMAIADDATEELAVGDRIIYREYGGTKLEVDGETVLLLEAEDLLVKYISADAIPD